MSATMHDALVAFTFYLDLEGVGAAYFTTVSGLGTTIDAVEHKVVNDSGLEQTLKIPGRISYNDVTVSRAVTTDLSFSDWMTLVIEGKIADARTNGSLIMYDQTMSEISRWNFTNCWPSAWTLSSVDAGNADLVTEDLTFVVEFLERVS